MLRGDKAYPFPRFPLLKFVVGSRSNGCCVLSVYWKVTFKLAVMNKRTICLGSFFLMGVGLYMQADAQSAAEKYPVDSASVEQPGVPKGEVLKFVFDHSTI